LLFFDAHELCSYGMLDCGCRLERHAVHEHGRSRRHDGRMSEVVRLSVVVLLMSKERLVFVVAAA
jgi:hypothetical protein